MRAAILNGLTPPVQVEGREAPPASLDARMAALNVPAVSVAYFRGYEIVWVEAFGSAGVDTLFQAASITKPVTAMTALSLVEDGRLGLDEDIAPRLVGWRLPDNPYPADTPLTLRRLLSHDAGLGVPHFAGYDAGAPLPGIIEILEGTPPANNLPVRVEHPPGQGPHYSGGGYMVVQHLLESVAGRPLAELSAERVFAAAGMSDSLFFMGEPPPGSPPVAQGHDSEGVPYPGGHVRYPETAAAGLWTTPSDLARLAIAVQNALSGGAGGPLQPATTQEMLTTQAAGWGLGWELRSVDGLPAAFYHSGANRGFKAMLYARRRGGEGVAIMANGDNGSAIISEFLAGMAVLRDWPDQKPTLRPALSLTPQEYEAYVGEYAFSAPVAGRIVIRAYADRITLEAPGIASETEFFPETRLVFFELNGAKARFDVGPDGRARRVAVGDLLADRVAD